MLVVNTKAVNTTKTKTPRGSNGKGIMTEAGFLNASKIHDPLLGWQDNVRLLDAFTKIEGGDNLLLILENGRPWTTKQGERVYPGLQILGLIADKFGEDINTLDEAQLAFVKLHLKSSLSIVESKMEA